MAYLALQRFERRIGAGCLEVPPDEEMQRLLAEATILAAMKFVVLGRQRILPKFDTRQRRIYSVVDSRDSDEPNRNVGNTEEGGDKSKILQTEQLRADGNSSGSGSSEGETPARPRRKGAGSMPPLNSIGRGLFTGHCGNRNCVANKTKTTVQTPQFPLSDELYLMIQQPSPLCVELVSARKFLNHQVSTLWSRSLSRSRKINLSEKYREMSYFQ
jgi:hypothetical protein